MVSFASEGRKATWSSRSALAVGSHVFATTVCDIRTRAAGEFRRYVDRFHTRAADNRFQFWSYGGSGQRYDCFLFYRMYSADLHDAGFKTDRVTITQASCTCRQINLRSNRKY